MRIDGTRLLQGDAFHLRPIAESDSGLIVAASVSDVPDWTYIPRGLDEQGAREWIGRRTPAAETGRAVRFVIVVDGELAGTVGAEHPYAHDSGVLETFYFILPPFRRRGLATAGLRLLNEWAQSVTPELRRLQLHVILSNAGSGRVAELAGYRHKGAAVHQIPSVNGYGPRDADVYGKAVVPRDEAGIGGVLA